MKKNFMMRAASALLVAVLLSTCTISGTFAKYTTEASGGDTARVAKWGVEVYGMADTLFAKTYAKDSTTAITNTVVAEEKVVAPGTKNDTGVTFSLTGKPEVAVRVTFNVTNAAGTGNPVDVVLPVGTDYKDWTQAPYTGTFNVTGSDYKPLVFTLKDGTTPLKTGTLAEIKAFLEVKNGDYEAGTDLKTILGGTTGSYTLTWAWNFGPDTNDKADTYLGNVIAGVQIDTDAVTSIDFGITVTVTQID